MGQLFPHSAHTAFPTVISSHPRGSTLPTTSTMARSLSLMQRRMLKTMLARTKPYHQSQESARPLPSHGSQIPPPPPLPLVSQVSQSLSNWQGHSVHDSSDSERSSPAPGWATQVEFEEFRVAEAEDANKES